MAGEIGVNRGQVSQGEPLMGDYLWSASGVQTPHTINGSASNWYVYEGGWGWADTSDN